MKCDFCKTDYKEEFICRERFDEGEIYFICKGCKEKVKEYER
jgi:hypothetical protein